MLIRLSTLTFLVVSLSLQNVTAQSNTCKIGHDKLVTGQLGTDTQRVLTPGLATYTEPTDIHVYNPHGSSRLTVLVINSNAEKIITTLEPMLASESDQSLVPQPDPINVLDQNKHRFFRSVKYLVVLTSEPEEDGTWKSATVCITNTNLKILTNGAFFSTDK